MPPVGSTIGIYNLGQAHVAATDWSLTPTRFHDIIEATLQELNPSLTDLIEMHGDATEGRGKVRYTMLGSADDKPFRRSPDGSEVLGHALPVFVRQSDAWLLTQWFIFADGLAQLGCEGDLLPLDDAARMIIEGEVTTRVPDGSWITMDHLGRFQSKKGRWEISLVERIREAYRRVDYPSGPAWLSSALQCRLPVLQTRCFRRKPRAPACGIRSCSEASSVFVRRPGLQNSPSHILYSTAGK